MLQVLVAIFQMFCCRKKTWGYAKVIQKSKEKKKRREFKKMDKCSRYLKQRVLRCPLEKKKKDE
jgi:hypothetical protein